MGASSEQPTTRKPTHPAVIGLIIGVVFGWAVLTVGMAVTLLRGDADTGAAPEPGPVVIAPLDTQPLSQPDWQPVEPIVPDPSPQPTIPQPTTTQPVAQFDGAALRVSLASIEQQSGGRLSVSYIGPDLKSGFAYQGTDPKPAGDTIKLCLLVSALGRIDTGEWEPGTNLPGTGMTLDDALMSMMMGSEPTAANAVIQRGGIEDLNREIHAYMGLSATTRLERSLQDMQARAAGKENVVTTNDVAKLLHDLAAGQLLSRESTQFAIEAMCNQAYRNKIPRGIPFIQGLTVANRPAELPDMESDAAVIGYPDGRWSVLVIAVNGHTDSATARQAVANASATIWAAVN